MKNTLKLILITFSLLSGLALNAISCEAIEVDAAGCQVVLVNDIHVDNKVNKKGPKQRQMILDNIVQMNEEAKVQNKQPVLLMVEDMLAYDGPHKLVKENVEKESLQVQRYAKNQPDVEFDQKAVKEDSLVPVVSVLANLTRDARELGIDCYNAECRQLKRVSRGVDLIVGNDIANEFEYNTELIMKELEKLKIEAQHNEVARAVYNECCKIMELSRVNSHDTIDLLRRTPKSLRQLAIESDIEFAKAYNPLHDRHLLDARFLIEWYKNRSRDVTVIVAGEVHTENVLKVFETLGYTITRHGTKFPFDDEGLELSMNNCLDFNNVFKDLKKQDNSWSTMRTAFQAVVDTVRRLVA